MKNAMNTEPFEHVEHLSPRKVPWSKYPSYSPFSGVTQIDIRQLKVDS